MKSNTFKEIMPNYSWNLCNTLDDFSENSNGGVYLLVFKGSPKRIIYVGTTHCFSKRLLQHKIGYLNGNRTLWKTSLSEDIYELMSSQGLGRVGRFKYYASLAKKGLLWASTTIEKDLKFNDLNPKENFQNTWKEYSSTFFVKNIEVWTCNMYGDQERALALESKIQTTFQKNYNIASHINGEGMCFLGKIEIRENLSKYKFNFLNSPDLGKDDIKLINELPDIKIIDFKKKLTRKKSLIKTNKIKEARKTRRFAYTSWDDIENDILFSCCMLNIEIKDIAESYLQRTDKEVSQRIKYLSKYYTFPKNYT
ncbi:hypothetical protein [Gelidibacter pelagius]|uniref:GIY-YIG domain-containing protein n=1 Tax=Gelidibacter pelagius TaxID=2819985 RepID=A0ABS3SRF1_9FLAO|nr:hypothetical protein [Gelidibacter pelagius]MBO3098279.1 hypothetical protein [Gelidibacter pelagius]